MNRPLVSPGGNGAAWLLALAAVWFWTGWHLAVEWRFNDQYNYGYAVPWLAAFVGWRRLRHWAAGDPRPAAHPPSAPVVWAIVAAWFMFLLAELLRRQDPTWRLVGWLMTFAASVLTAACLYRCGGRPLLQPMVFAIAFAWLALPWPAPVENRVTQGLMGLVTATVVNLLNWTGVAAVQHANVIELSRGLVGVDTACSGVQSLQASLLAAVFLGELYWLRRWPRLILVGLGWMLALLGNLLRVLLLTRSVELNGAPGLERYHDPVGYTLTAVTFLSLWALAAWIARNHAGTGQNPSPILPQQKPLLAGRDGYAVLLTVASVPLLAGVWFMAVPGARTLSVQAAPRWSLAKNGLAPGWRAKEVPFAPAERATLRFSEGEGLLLSSPDGWTAQVLHFFWKPDAQVPSMAFSHTPDICMPSAGWQQVDAAAPVTIKLRNSALPCLLYRFRLGRQEQAVLHTIWYGGQPEPLGDPAWTGAARGSRLEALWKGPFRRGHESITVFLPVVASADVQLHLGEEILLQILTPARSTRVREAPK